MKVRELMAILIQMDMDDEIEFRPVVRPTRSVYPQALTSVPEDVKNAFVADVPGRITQQNQAPEIDPDTQRMIDRAAGPASTFDDIFSPL